MLEIDHEKIMEAAQIDEITIPGIFVSFFFLRA